MEPLQEIVDSNTNTDITNKELEMSALEDSDATKDDLGSSTTLYYDTRDEISYPDFINFSYNSFQGYAQSNANSDPEGNLDFTNNLNNSVLPNFDPLYNRSLIQDQDQLKEGDLASLITPDNSTKEVFSNLDHSHGGEGDCVLIDNSNNLSIQSIPDCKKIDSEVKDQGISVKGQAYTDVNKVLGDIIETALDKIEQSSVKGTVPLEESKPNSFETEKNMAEVSDKLALENVDLKLQLNAALQARATLELQLRQKEEIIIKFQTETLRKEQSYKQELKVLLEKKDGENNNSLLEELKEAVKSLKSREAKLSSDLQASKSLDRGYRSMIDKYVKTFEAQLGELKKSEAEHSTAKLHLANLELAFSDVHQKYERCKKIIEGYKRNEDSLRQTLIMAGDCIDKSQAKYDTLKAHAKTQLEKSNQEVQAMREHYESELQKLNAIIKRLDIKISSLTDTLDQKTKECSALAALCDEVTGKV